MLEQDRIAVNSADASQRHIEVSASVGPITGARETL